MSESEDGNAPTEAKRAKLDDFSADANKISEKEVGIDEYVQPNQTGFKGTLKGRFVSLSICHSFKGGRISLFVK